MQNSFTRFFMSLLVILGNLQPVSAMIVPRLNSAPKRSNFSKKDCKALIKQLEQEYAIPEGLLAAIGAVESEHTPYAVNCNGKARMFTSHDAAKAYVRELRKQGIIDINIWNSEGTQLTASNSIDISLTLFAISKLLVDANGKVIVIGYDYYGSAGNVVIIRTLNNSLALDPTFNAADTPGYLKYIIGDVRNQGCWGGLIHPDGRIIIPGSQIANND